MGCVRVLGRVASVVVLATALALGLPGTYAQSSEPPPSPSPSPTSPPPAGAPTTATTAAATLFPSGCARVCGAFETCVVYGDREYCAPTCAPGRCDDATAVCVLEGQRCDPTDGGGASPCLPVAVCEPRLTGLSPEVPPEPPTCGRPCPGLDAPVCGSDGVSYANACYLQVAQCTDPTLGLAALGLCPGDRDLNRQFNPNGDGNGNGNGGSTTTSTGCDAIVCADADDPVCTTAGTLRNVCVWRRAACRDPRVELLNPRGACPADTSNGNDSPNGGGGGGMLPACPTECSETFAPVCGSNGVLYGNDCRFRQAHCARVAFGGLTTRELSYCTRQVGDSTGPSPIADLTSLLAQQLSRR